MTSASDRIFPYFMFVLKVAISFLVMACGTFIVYMAIDGPHASHTLPEIAGACGIALFTIALIVLMWVPFRRRSKQR